MIKIVRAKNNSLAAGRDLHITLNVGSDGPQIQEAVASLAEKLGLTSEQFLDELNVASESELTADRLLFSFNQAATIQSLNQVGTSGKYKKFAAEALKVTQQVTTLESQFLEIATALEQQDYSQAYTKLKVLISATGNFPKLTPGLIEDCFQCGYLHFANHGKTSDFEELFSLLDIFDSELVSAQTIILVLEMQQEHSTRQKEEGGLQTNLKRVRSYLDTFNGEPMHLLQLQILKALCLRRLGERGDIGRLNEAETLLLSLERKASFRPVEFGNTLANIQLRIASKTGDRDALERALVTLEKVPSLPSKAEISEVQAYPKYLNAFGNYYKEKTKLKPTPSCYARSIEQYTKAELFWKEENAPYEWAMLQKNKADVRQVFMNATQKVDAEDLKAAHQEIIISLRYRTKENSEYQFQESMKVLDKITDLAEIHSIVLSE